MRKAPVHACAIALALLLAGGASAQDRPQPDPTERAEPAAPRSRVLARGEPAPDDERGSEDPLRTLRSVRHIEIRARDMRLRETAMKRLERIAARYHAATGKRLVVTGGYRTSRRQAELMARKLAHGEDIGALYEQRAAAIAIRDAYQAGEERGLKKAALVDLVHEVIEDQIGRGIFVSRHLQGRAADIRSRGMTAAQLEALRSAVTAEPGATLVDERDGDAPHFHLKV